MSSQADASMPIGPGGGCRTGISGCTDLFQAVGLKITDLRLAVVASNYDYPILRIDTNQGVYGIGEVRDAGIRRMRCVSSRSSSVRIPMLTSFSA